MYVLAMSIDLKLPGCASLKEKRAALRPVIDGIRHRQQVSVAETGHHDLWQRAGIGVAVVSVDETGADEAMDRIERFVWSRPDVEVISTERYWLEIDR